MTLKCGCTCADWEPNRKVIDGGITMAWLHGCKQGVKPFRFCPYCGKELVQIEFIQDQVS